MREPETKPAGRCGTCRWWRDLDDYRLRDPAPAGATEGACAMASEEWPVAGSLAVVESSEGMSRFKTQRNFGCVQWEKR